MANGSERAGGGAGYGSVGDGRVGYGARLHACLRVLAVLVGRLRPELYSGDDARRLAELFAWGEKLCATGKALTAGRVAATGAWESSGERSAADWLGRVSGQTAGQAAQALEAARRLADLPDVEAAARAGKLSADQNRAVTAAAAKAPERSSELLDTAGRDSLVGLRERSQEIRLAADEATSERARYKAVHAGRFVRTWTDPDGSGRLSGRFTPDALAEIVSAMAPFQQQAFDAARAAGIRERPECHAADALVAMARAATGQDLPPPGCGPSKSGGPAPGGGDGRADTGVSTEADEHGPAGSGDGAGAVRSDNDGPAGGGGFGGDGSVRSGGDGGGRTTGPGPWNGADRPDTTVWPDDTTVWPDDTTVWPDDPDPGGDSDGGPAPTEPGSAGGSGPVRTRRPAMIIVRIDHAALIRGYRTADECCEIAGIGPVPVATVQAMMTDAFLAAVVTDGTDIRSVVHLGRQVTARQETALWARDRQCVVPGCHARTGLEIDHVDGWSQTRITTIDALARLCKHHHHQKTYNGWRLHGPPGHWQWTNPDHPNPPHPDPPEPDLPKPPAPPSTPTGGPAPRAPDPNGSRGDDSSTPSLFDTSDEPLPP